MRIQQISELQACEQFAFSIGQSQLEDLQRYIANQRDHHRRESFEDEFRRLLAKYEIEADERYLWD